MCESQGIPTHNVCTGRGPCRVQHYGMVTAPSLGPGAVAFGAQQRARGVVVSEISV